RVESTPALCEDGEEDALLHDMVWGFFVSGGRYHGAWTRVLPQVDSKGLVNCHQGATISIIFQVDE
ncbi:MAG: hypothetical protein GY940_27355, partial [bacterium]|nr:hypothetical protein [bacterium]